MHTCILDNEVSECLVAPQLPLALCGYQPGHTECSCVNFTGVHKHMVHTYTRGGPTLVMSYTSTRDPDRQVNC